MLANVVHDNIPHTMQYKFVLLLVPGCHRVGVRYRVT